MGGHRAAGSRRLSCKAVRYFGSENRKANKDPIAIISHPESPRASGSQQGGESGVWPYHVHPGSEDGLSRWVRTRIQPIALVDLLA